MARSANQDNWRRLPAMNNEEWEQTPESVKYLTSFLWDQVTNPSHQLEPLDKRVSLRDILHVIRKRWVIILLIFAATTIASVVYTHNPIPVYEAKSVLLVGFGRGYISRSPVDESTLVSGRDREVVINAELQILHSRDLLASVIKSLGGPKVLYPGLVKDTASYTNHQLLASVRRVSAGLKSIRFFKPYFGENQGTLPQHDTPKMADDTSSNKLLEKAVNRFHDFYSVEPVPTSDVMEISFRHQNPEIAAKAVNQVVHFFKEKHNEIFNGVPVTDFLEKQVSSHWDELEKIEEKLNVFLTENKYLPPEEYGKSLLDQQRNLKASTSKAKNQVSGLKNKIVFLKKESKKHDLFADPETERVINEIKTKLLNLRLEEQKLLSTYKEKSSIVINHRKKMEMVENFLKEQKATIRNRASYKQFQMDIVKLQSELRFQENSVLDLSEQLDHVNRELQEFPKKQDKYRHLIRQRDLKEDSYYKLLKKLDEARISKQVDNQDAATVNVIQKAIVPSRPAPSGRKAKIALGILLGTTMGVGLAFFVENVSSSQH
jgi:uncharacterized protein involved in exopolysaccharide biosynthesis